MARSTTAPPELDPAHDLVGLIPLLAAAYGVVLGAVALITGWQLFSDRKPRRKWRDAGVPPVGAIERTDKGAR